MTVDLFNASLLPHQGTLLYVQHAVFYACALLRTTPSSSRTLRYQSYASSGMGMYARSLLPAMRQPKLN